MDWTGGARRRFAPKKNNATIQRQKAYFAKARAALNNTNPSNTPLQPFTNHSNPGSRGRLLSHQSLLENETAHELYARSRTSTQGLGGEEKRHGWETRPSSRKREPKPSRSRSPSAISVISINSRRASLTQSRQAKEQQKSYHHITPAAANMNEEERLLHANRRRLLAQGDWLGLAPTQPLRMKFSTSHDKDRIGKRRKVDSVRSKKDGPGQRLITPLFDERLLQQDHFMSGVLRRDDFHFKIGTDALATQTQPSNRSYTPGKTSLIQPSTDFELLSEESMLLGPDDDTFDPFQTPYESMPPGQPSSPQTQHLCGVPDMRRPRGERITEEEQDTQSADIYLQDEARPHDGGIQRNEQKRYEWFSDDGLPPNTHGPTHQGGAHVMAATHQRGADESAPYQLHERVGDDRSSAPPSTANSSAADDDGNDDYDDDDELWRKFMKAPKPGSSNPSIMAVKSSSFHMTTSQSSHRPILIRLDELRDSPLVSTPNGAGTQGQRTHGHVQTVSEDTSPEPTEGSRSPAASLKQTEGFAMQPPALVGAAQDDEDQDALWRQFVCGTQDDSDTSSQLGLARRNQDRDAWYSPALVPASPSYMVSRLGTSNHTTIGDGTMLMPGSMSTPWRRRTTSPSHYTKSPEEVEFTKALKAAVPDDNDDDSIEDDEPSAAQKHQAKNIHATERSILNPKRFKPPRKRRSPPARPMPTQFLARQPQLQTAKQGLSVYDLVDSDGNSVARRYFAGGARYLL